MFNPMPHDCDCGLPGGIHHLTVGSTLSSGILRRGVLMLRNLTFRAPGAGSFGNMLANLSISSGTLVMATSLSRGMTLSTHGVPNMAIISTSKVAILSILGRSGLVVAGTTIRGMRRILTW